MPPTQTHERGDWSQVGESTDTQPERSQLCTLQPLSVEGIWCEKDIFYVLI